MEQNITIKVNSTYKYLQLWNGIFNLTDMELKVLSTLVDFQIQEKAENLCASDIKKKAARSLGISDFNTLNNYVKKFKDKRAIRKVGKNYVLNQLLDVRTTGVKVNIKRES